MKDIKTRAHSIKYILPIMNQHIHTYIKMKQNISQNSMLPAVLYSDIFYFVLYHT